MISPKIKELVIGTALPSGRAFFVLKISHKKIPLRNF